MSKERTYFGNAIRKSTTAEFFPDKISLKDFEEMISNGIHGFADNMRHLAKKPDSAWNKDQYLEFFMEHFSAWMEIEQERDL